MKLLALGLRDLKLSAGSSIHSMDGKKLLLTCFPKKEYNLHRFTLTEDTSVFPEVYRVFAAITGGDGEACLES